MWTVPGGNRTIASQADPDWLAVSPEGERVYVVRNGVPDGVAVIDTATNTVIATIDFGDGPSAVAVSPDGTHVYLAKLFLDGTVSVITLA